MKRLLAVILATLFICGIFAACGDDKKGKEDKEGKEGSDELFTIETEYADLRYPSKWEDKVKVDTLDDNLHTVRVSSDSKSIFDITFTDGNTMLGTLTTDDGPVNVYVLFYELDKKDKNYEDYAAMQDDVNVITENLAKDYDFSIGKPLLENDGKTFEIETKLVTMHYPQRWKDSVKVEADEKAVAFSCDGTPLFTIHFGAEKGELLGTYNGTKLWLETFGFDKNTLSAEQIAVYEAMQEDVNVILQNLYGDDKFELPI